MRARLHIALFLLTALLALHAPTPAHAGPFDNIIPQGIPNPFSHNDLGKQAQDFLRDQLGKALGEESPFVIDPNQVFQQVPANQAPTVDSFKPTPLKTLADLNRPLTPGDYSFNAMFYCTQWSVHRPGRGHPYTIGRAQGRLARQMSTLLYRGTIKHIAPSTMNAMAWRIQAGVPLNQWSDQEKTLVHQLTPEYENDLQGDWLYHIEDKYNHTFRLATRKSFDDELRTIGDLGQLALNLKAAHQTLSDKRVVPERLPDLMFQQFGAGGNPQLPDDPDHPSSWMSVATGVMARFTVHEGNLGENLVELRVTPEASGNAIGTDKGPTLSEIVNGTGTDEGRGLVGYSPDSQCPLFDPNVKDDPDNSDGAIKIVSYQPTHDDTQKGDPNKVIFPLQAQITPKGKASTVNWSFKLKKPDGTENDGVLSFDASVADCVDKADPLKVDLQAYNIEGRLTITAQASIDGKSQSDSVSISISLISDDPNVGPQKGDVVIYRKNGLIKHSGLVAEVDGKVVTKIISKWGIWGLYEHNPLYVPDEYGTWTVYRTKRAGGNLLQKSLVMEKDKDGNMKHIVEYFTDHEDKLGNLDHEIPVLNEIDIRTEYLPSWLLGKDPTVPDAIKGIGASLYAKLTPVSNIGDPTLDYDCHGYTFAMRQRWIGLEHNNGKEVDLILRDNGYNTIPALDTTSLLH